MIRGKTVVIDSRGKTVLIDYYSGVINLLCIYTLCSVILCFTIHILFLGWPLFLFCVIEHGRSVYVCKS